MARELSDSDSDREDHDSDLSGLEDDSRKENGAVAQVHAFTPVAG